MDPERAQFIADLANDEWVDRVPKETSQEEFDRLGEEWERKCEDFLSTVDSPDEIHLFASLWNWDTGYADLKRLLENPKCQYATALLVFWRAGAEHYQSYASADQLPEGDERETYAFLRELERQLLAGQFPKLSASYAPKKDAGMLLPPSAGASWKKWTIHEQLYEPVNPIDD